MGPWLAGWVQSALTCRQHRGNSLLDTTRRFAAASCFGAGWEAVQVQIQSRQKCRDVEALGLGQDWRLGSASPSPFRFGLRLGPSGLPTVSPSLIGFSLGLGPTGYAHLLHDRLSPTVLGSAQRADLIERRASPWWVAATERLRPEGPFLGYEWRGALGRPFRPRPRAWRGLPGRCPSLSEVGPSDLTPVLLDTLCICHWGGPPDQTPGCLDTCCIRLWLGPSDLTPELTSPALHLSAAENRIQEYGSLAPSSLRRLAAARLFDER